MSKRQTRLTAEEAEMLLEQFDMDEVFVDESEERELMNANNPELLAVYDKLKRIAEGN